MRFISNALILVLSSTIFIFMFRVETFAGIIFEYEEKSNFNDNSTEKVRYYLKQNKLRTDIDYDYGKISIIITIDPVKIYLLNKKDNLCQAISKKQYVNMIALGSFVNQQIAPHIKIKKVNAEEIINNHKCVKLEMSFEKNKEEVWISNNLDGYDDFKKWFTEFKKIFGSFPGANPMASGFQNEYHDYVMVKKISKDNTITLKRFEEIDIDDSIFEKPKGCIEEDTLPPAETKADIIAAAERGDISEIMKLFAGGANVNAIDDEGETALMHAALNGHLDVVRALLEKDAEVNTKSDKDLTALILAATGKSVEIVKVLLNKGADVNAKQVQGFTALHLAVQHGNFEIAQTLLNRGADVNAKTNEGTTAIVKASEIGQHKIVKILLDKGADVNAKRNNGETALFFAAQNDHLEVVKILLERGADPNVKDNYGGTALLSALSVTPTDNLYEIVKVLLDKGADINVKMRNGATAIEIASQKGDKKVLDLLQNAELK